MWSEYEYMTIIIKSIIITIVNTITIINNDNNNNSNNNKTMTIIIQLQIENIYKMKTLTKKTLTFASRWENPSE